MEIFDCELHRQLVFHCQNLQDLSSPAGPSPMENVSNIFLNVKVLDASIIRLSEGRQWQ